MKYYALVGDREYEVEIEGDQVYVDGDLVEVDLQKITEPELYSMLYNGHSYELVVEAARYNYTVLVRGDQNVAYGKVIQAMALLQQAGVNNVGLVTEPPRQGKHK